MNRVQTAYFSSGVAGTSLLFIAGCNRPAPPPVHTAATPAPDAKATTPPARKNVAAVRHGLIGKWARADGVIRASFTNAGVYILYVVNATTGPKVRGAASQPQSPVSRNSRGTYKLVDASHIQFTNHGRSIVNGIAITGNQMTLTNPDGTAQEWSRIR